MKRQSIAETTLKKQIKILDAQIDAASEDAEWIGARILTLNEIRENLEAEVFALEEARKSASENRK